MDRSDFPDNPTAGLPQLVAITGIRRDLPRCAIYRPHMPFPLPRRRTTGAYIGCFPLVHGPSPKFRRVDLRNCTFEACSGFTRVRPVGLLRHLMCPLSPELQRRNCSHPPSGWLPRSANPSSDRTCTCWHISPFRGILNNPGYIVYRGLRWEHPLYPYPSNNPFTPEHKVTLLPFCSLPNNQ